MNNRTKVFQLRLTPEEAVMLKEKAAAYGSVSHYIRCAVAECSNVNAKQRLELIDELGAFYREYRDRLSWAGGNLNQSVKRANELAIAGKLAYGSFCVMRHNRNPDVYGLCRRFKTLSSQIEHCKVSIGQIA